jgi:hypothetical protein
MTGVSSWLRNNNLVLNLSKTHLIKFITLRSPEYSLTVMYNGRRLGAVNRVTFLGLNLDCQLSWQQHTEKLLKKQYSMFFA